MQTQSTAFPARSVEPFCATPNRSEEILLELPQALLVLLPDRSLVFANASAEDLLTDGFAREIDGRLTRIGQLDAPLIEDLLRRTGAGHGTQAGLWFREMQAGWVSASRVPPAITGNTDWPPESVLLLIHLDEPKLTQPARVEALCERCGLTPTERYVLLLLADGMVPQEIARQLAVQVCTIRTHIRNLLGKTRWPSLMHLVRQVGSTAPLEGCM
jgi:DNA-binding CsgD family transcriptional regulator